jgi:PAS domain S-box-containing protein
MNPDLPIINNDPDFFDRKVDAGLQRILLFVCEICEVFDGFITSVNNNKHQIEAKYGLDNLKNPYEITCFKEVLVHEEVLIISDNNNEARYSGYSYSFFAGFPIHNSEGLMQGTFCLFNKDFKTLSSVELKIINEAAAQIESLFQLNFENKKLQGLINRNANQTFNEFDFDRNLTVELTTQRLNKKTFDFSKKRNERKYSQFSKPEMIILIHELESYQIEMKVQNEEISIARESIETACRQYSDLYDLAPSGYFTLSEEGKIMNGNYALARMVGEERSKFINSQFAFFISEESRSIYNTFFETIFNSSSKQTCKLFLVSKKNIRIPVVLTGTIFQNRKECLITAVDITGINNNLNETYNSTQLVSSILQNVGVGIIVQGPQTEILEYNNMAFELLGVTEKQFLSETSTEALWNIIHADGSHFKPEDYPLSIARKQLKTVTSRIMGVHRCMNNDLVWLLVSAVPVLGDQGELLYVVCSYSNITSLKKAEEALKISNKRFYYASKAISTIIWDWEISAKDVFVSNSYRSQFGHNLFNDRIAKQEFENYLHHDDCDSIVKGLKETIDSTSSKWTAEYRYLRSDGSYADIKDKAIIIRDKDGNAVRMIGAMQDISIEKKLINDLRLSEEQFKGAFEYSSIGMAIVNTSGRWELVNDRIIKIFGYNKKELNESTFETLTHPEDLAEELANFSLLKSGVISNYTLEKRYFHKNLSIIWGRLSVSVVRDNFGKPLHYIFQIVNITKKKEIEAANKLLLEENNKNKTIQLNEARGMYRLLADNTIDLVCLHQMNSKLKYISPSVYGILGYLPEELQGLYPLNYVHPKDLHKLVKIIISLQNNNEEKVVKLRLRNKVGIYIRCETKISFVIEDGVIVSFRSASRDITKESEAKYAINKATNKELKLNKLRVNLVSTISHELRTPMSTILSNTDLIEMYLHNKKLRNISFIDERINVIRGEIERIVSLMDSVLVIAKYDSNKGKINVVAFDLKQFCLKIISEGNYQKTKRRDVKVLFIGDAFPVFADMKLMEYILINLLKNAFKYSEGSQDVILNLFIKEAQVVIEIIDFGMGIPESEQENVFNIFFRGSNTNGIDGTGLGLYIVKIFTEINHGCIKLESKLGQGTKVRVKFPMVK